MIAALLFVPLAGSLAAFLTRPDRIRRAILVACAGAHSALCVAMWRRPWILKPGAWLGLDPLGTLFLSLVSLLFLCAAVYAVAYLRREQRGRIADFEEDLFFVNEPEAIFTGCLLLFLATMTLVTVSQHFGVLWVAVESTTLASAPLIYFHRHHRSLEAAWKYLLICSVGIAVALLGTFCLALAPDRPAAGLPLVVGEFLRYAPALRTPWLKAAFLLFLIGYGTKMGLAPLHTWLPDAHSEAPSVVSALLSAALLNCAFLAILRMYQVGSAAGLAGFMQPYLIVFGFLSMGVAAVFLFNQPDFKRLLAYSSVEHMGILALGIGIGGMGWYGAMLHAVNHSLAKAMLFFVAGNLIAAYQSKAVEDVRGAAAMAPASGWLWLAGLFPIGGSPPFGLFLSEWIILKAVLDGGRYGLAALYLLLLGMIFVAMASAMLPMVQGQPPARPGKTAQPESWLSILPPAALAILVLALGVAIPHPVGNALAAAAKMLEVIR